MSTSAEQAGKLPERVSAPSPGEILKRFLQGDLASLRVFVVLAFIWIIFQLENSHFLTALNLTNLFLQITAVGLISVGVVFVLLLGEIDLSGGAVSGLTSAVMAGVLSQDRGGGAPGPGRGPFFGGGWGGCHGGGVCPFGGP